MNVGDGTAAPAVEDGAAKANERTLRVSPAPKAPVTSPAAREEPAGAIPADGEILAAVNLQQVNLASFIQVVYAEILKKPVSPHASVATRQDLVTFRSGGGQTAAQLEQAVRVLLKSYGLSVVEAGGLVRIVPDNATFGDLPSLRFGATTPDVPSPLRPVFHLVTLTSVRQTDVTNWLRTMFGDRVKVSEDAGRNAVLLSGNPDNIKSALEAIDTLDQPAMKGRTSLALTPAYWSAEELARRLHEVLSAEGYAVHPIGQAVVPGASRSPVILLPVSALNAIYVFANSDTVANHVANWARNLDRPGERGVGKNFFQYAVKHKDAELLAQTLDRVLGGSRVGNAGATASTAPAGQAGAAAATGTAPQQFSSVVVDKSTNTLIFQSRPEDYGQLTGLLESLDRPAKSALIEVTVAELSLTDSRDIGVDWLSNRITSDRSYTVSSRGGGGIGGTTSTTSAGLSFQVFNGAGAMRAAVNALASDNRATILSSPRLMARNGESATIQVGSEVPIITSQQQAAVGNTGGGILQTVQYRSTGVILKIKPVIHSGDQIDLDVSQEVSDASKTETGVSSSPTFGTRRIETKLTLRNGATVLLGGLISEKGEQGGAGVPWLKDIPLLGNLFSKQSKSGERRELIILITPYIANDSHEAEAITEAFRKTLGGWAGRAKPEAAERATDGARR
ncbi:secretin N-terminal domain-containing protein [Paucibacter sp. JuS9]|uniref:secretin N-terminal domain-containing protein n=1 Tax=Roseateles TaxID=93681 RepID=UPI002FE53E76